MKQFLLILLTVVILLIPINANAAEPPALTIIVSNPPDDLELIITFPNDLSIEAIELSKDTKAWEAYYRFYWSSVSNNFNGYNAVLMVKSNYGSFDVPISENMHSYNNILTLDYANRTLTEGQTISRTITLVGLRVGLTLIIEGLIFFLFGYRKKSSWLIFLITNLITQGILNINLSNSLNASYLFFGLIFYEIIIYFVELITYLFLLREKPKSRAVFYALTANVASFVLGGILIACLPV